MAADESTSQDFIEAAADFFDVDLDHAVVAQDDDPESDRIYIIEEAGDGYRLMAYGLDADGDHVVPEDPLHIPESAVGAVQGLLHAAGLHCTNQGLLTGGDHDISIRDLSERMGVSKPLGSEADAGDR